MCRVVFEDEVGGGGILRDKDGVARALFSDSSNAKDVDLVELDSIKVTLELYSSKGWETSCKLTIEVGSNLVFKWLLKIWR